MKINKKLIGFLTVLLISSILFLNFSYKRESKKLALIIGISKYKKQWSRLNTETDVKLIKESLIKKGFEEENIIILKDSFATKKNIKNIFKEHLIDNAEEGDILVFHFSGHGQQVMDNNNDEADGYDESLVPYDADAIYTRKYTGQNHLIDDELNLMIYEARKKIGKKGSLMFIIDACYSGTISRGGNVVIRGDKDKLAPRSYKPILDVKFANTSGAYEVKKSDEKNLGKFVVFSGARQDQPNFETYDLENNPVGSLSLAFSRSIVKINKNTSYLKLFDQIKIEMAHLVPQQTPQAEGDLENKVFGGKTKEVKEYYMIKEQINDSIYIMNAGGLNGIFEGTTFSVYDINTKKIKKKNKKVSGYVIKSTEFDSEIVIKSDFKLEELKRSIIYIDNQSFGPLEVNILLDLENKNRVARILKNHKLIEIVEEENVYNADAIIKKTLNKFKENILHFIIKNEDDTISVKIENDKAKTIAHAIEKEMIFFSKAKYIRSLNLINPDLDVQLEVLPVEYQLINRRPKVTKIYEEKSKIKKNGQLVFDEGDVVILQIINKGNFTAFFSVIDISPDNSISVLIPDKKTPASDVKILPKDTIIFKTQLMLIGKPFGNDMLKVVASRKPIDNLRKIVSSPEERKIMKSLTNRAFISHLEELMLNTMDGTGTRGLTPLSIPISEINIYSKILNIRPKQK
ncbi:MAG: hypothetical protein B6I24_04335 [Bacteroidetes bacterium 4572_128]|nr:MAG: hypothetical protein B6I24_04335 [Bacteroidetes bacterium 4572_128]